MGKSFDVVVIGAGNGGLAAAVKVLSSGKTCLVCERHNLPGGFATSFVRGRFEFEASLHELNGVGSGENTGSTKAMFDDLGVGDKIEWCPITDAFHLFSLKEKLDFKMPTGIDNCIKACSKLCKDGGKYMKQFLDMAKNIADCMTYLGECHGKPDPEIMKSKYSDYLATVGYSTNEVFKAMGLPREMKDVLSAYWSYIGSHLDELSFVHYANMSYKYFLMGAVAPRYRSHEMSSALANRIYELGGSIYFNSEVSKILTDEENHVCGVKLASGEEIETRHVIANCSPHVIYGKMLDKKVIPERALKLANYRKFSGRGFSVFLGLNKSPKELGLKDHCYFVYSSSDSVKVYNEMKDLYHAAGQATVCLNNVVKDASPKGTAILYMTTLFTDDAWANVDEKDYYKVKNKIAKGLITRFEKATGVNLHDNIEEIAIATPQTYARYCGHPQGTIYGYESLPNDSLMQRIMMVNEDAMIKGLRYGGGWGERLDGFSSAYKSGYNEARRTLADIEKEGK